MKLYHSQLSPNSLRTRAVIHALGAHVEMIPVDFRAGANKTPEYLAMNPNGKVPVFVDDDGFVIWESRAINAYLADKFPDSGLYPKDPTQRALVDQWSYWQAIHLGPTMQKLNYERVLKAMFGRGEPDPKVIEEALKDLAPLLAVLEKALEGQDFIAGDLSLADFALATTFTQRVKAEIPLADKPNITHWIERMERLPAWQKAVAEQPAVT